jgi:hypothetical protein
MNGNTRFDQTFRHDDPWRKVRLGQTDIEALPQQYGGMADNVAARSCGPIFVYRLSDLAGRVRSNAVHIAMQGKT